ncbi:MAG: lysophospholipid acyltransferase family protein [Pseudomonadota bacterium]
MIETIKLVLALLVIALVTLFLFPFQLVALKLNLGIARKIPLFWHRMVTKLFGIRIDIKGKLSKERPLLIAANHISWMDILVIGSIDELCFISKHEINELPGANVLARMQRTIFVVRDKRREVGKQAREITERMLSGDPVVLFAEGTTGDGQRVLGFKSALFGAAHYAMGEQGSENVFVQPVAISYKKLHGMPLGRTGRTLSAWTGDMTLAPHVLSVLRKPAWDVVVNVGDPVAINKETKRREVAAEMRKQIRSMFVQENFGRPFDDKG